MRVQFIRHILVLDLKKITAYKKWHWQQEIIEWKTHDTLSVFPLSQDAIYAIVTTRSNYYVF